MRTTLLRGGSSAVGVCVVELLVLVLPASPSSTISLMIIVSVESADCLSVAQFRQRRMIEQRNAVGQHVDPAAAAVWCGWAGCCWMEAAY